TRDTWFLRHKDAPLFVFIRADHFRQQLQQVVNDCHLTPGATLFSRCAECNQLLEVAAKETLHNAVPEDVWQTQDTFHHCPQCHRIYWGATHKAHVLEELRRMGITEEGSP